MKGDLENQRTLNCLDNRFDELRKNKMTGSKDVLTSLNKKDNFVGNVFY